MTDDDNINPFRALDQTGSYDTFVEAVKEQMDTFVFNYVGSEADWFRMRKALLHLIAEEDKGWDQAAKERDADEMDEPDGC